MALLSNKIIKPLDFHPVVVEEAGQLSAATLIALFEHWDRLRGARLAPARKEIRPAEISTLLPHIIILEALEGGQRARVRLVGSQIGQYLQPNYTGTILDDSIESEAERRNLAGIREVVRERRPMTCSFDVAHLPSLNFTASEVLWLPLSSDGETVDQILASFWLTLRNPRLPADFELS